MKFAIISAGEGSRLAQEGLSLPKPLARINGEAMIERLIRIFIRQGANEVIVIINDLASKTKDFLNQLRKELPIKLVIRTTPSSMHSFYEISSFLQDEKFCLTTVDTIFCEKEFSQFIKDFKESSADGLMAVTRFVDDESPLYIETDEQMNIQGFFDTPTPQCNYISGGIYCLNPQALKTLESCINKGMSRMRNFQRQLITDGLHLVAWDFSKIIDVDHVTDIIKAEEFLQTNIS